MKFFSLFIFVIIIFMLVFNLSSSFIIVSAGEEIAVTVKVIDSIEEDEEMVVGGKEIERDGLKSIDKERSLAFLELNNKNLIILSMAGVIVFLIVLIILKKRRVF